MIHYCQRLAAISFLLLAFYNCPALALDPAAWLAQQSASATARIFKNISPADGRPGAVLASPDRVYYFHWERDAALVMDVVAMQYGATTDSVQKVALYRALNDYLVFSECLQNLQTPWGYADAKYNVNCSTFTGGWNNPQTDGPALRALSFIHWAKTLLHEGQSDFVRQKLYDGKYPTATQTIIKKDLEFTAKYWRNASFDVWEEVKGDHFYTRMTQRRALIEGAELADALGDPDAAKYYRDQGAQIEQSLQAFWDADKGYIVATLNRVEGVDYKYENIDAAVILGLLHGSLDDGFLPLTDPKVLSTLEKYEAAFKNAYAINSSPTAPGVAIGRYINDRYVGGNPWVLTTLAFAEAYNRVATEFRNKGDVVNAEKYRQKALPFIATVQFHANPDGSLNEQFDRNTGYMESVTDLTWNYAAVLTTYFHQLRSKGFTAVKSCQKILRGKK